MSTCVPTPSLRRLGRDPSAAVTASDRSISRFIIPSFLFLPTILESNARGASRQQRRRRGKQLYPSCVAPGFLGSYGASRDYRCYNSTSLPIASSLSCLYAILECMLSPPLNAQDASFHSSAPFSVSRNGTLYFRKTSGPPGYSSFRYLQKGPLYNVHGRPYTSSRQ